MNRVTQASDSADDRMQLWMSLLRHCAYDSRRRSCDVKEKVSDFSLYSRDFRQN